MKRTIKRLSRVALVGSFLAVGLLAGPMHPSGAHAQWGNCFDDPVVFLSDGSIVDLSTTISAPASAVQSINYTLHVAPGLTVTRIVYPGPNLPYAENFTLANDATPGHFGSETVATVSSSVRVTAILASPSGGIAWTSGLSGQTLVVNL